MKLYQIANDPENYGDIAGAWLVVSDDLEEELSPPFKTKHEAKVELVRLRYVYGVRHPGDLGPVGIISAALCGVAGGVLLFFLTGG